MLKIFRNHRMCAFDVDVAAEYGLEETILFQSIVENIVPTKILTKNGMCENTYSFKYKQISAFVPFFGGSKVYQTLISMSDKDMCYFEIENTQDGNLYRVYILENEEDNK